MDKETLLNAAAVVRDENTESANTAKRIGELFINTIETLFDNDDALLNAISAAIATEVNRRNEAITSAISSEVTARNAAITAAIATAIAKEATNRNTAIAAALLQQQISRFAAYGADYDSTTGTWRMHKVGNDYLVTGLSAADMEVICAGVDINGAGSLFGALGSPYAGKTNRLIYTYTGIQSKTFPLIANSMANGNKSLEVFYSPYHANGLLCVSNLSAGFANCSALRVVKYLDVSKVTNYAGFGSAFLNCGNLEECYLKGFDAQKDIRTGHETDGTLNFSQSPKLTRESLVFIVENAGTAYEKNLRIPSGIYTAWNEDTSASPTWQEFTEMCVSKKISIHLA